MIDIEKRSLRTFKQNLAPALQGAMQINHRVRDERRTALRRPRNIAAFTSRKSFGFAPSARRMALFSRIFASSFFENSLGCIKSETRKPVRAALSP